MHTHTHTTQLDAEESEKPVIPITNVQIDGLVILKMLQHAQEYVPEPVGQCMGLGNNDTLEVTHCFPLICRKDNDEVHTHPHSTNTTNTTNTIDTTKK